MKHLWAITCHKEVGQVQRLCELLVKHFPESLRVVHLDGPEEITPVMDAYIIRSAYEPSKCKGILTALDRMAYHARMNDVDVVSFLHSDMIPLDRHTMDNFLHRFMRSEKVVAWSPMRPGSNLVSFCALHWRPELAGRLFPLRLDAFAVEGNYNELALTALWKESCPDWRDHAYPLLMANWPHSTCPEGGPNAKRMHSPAGSFVYHDLCLDTSIVHTNHPDFWENYERYNRS